MLVPLAAACVLIAPASSHASPGAVIRDCADDGRLQGHYSPSDLRRAQSQLPADLNEYSDCASVIAGAIPGGGHGGGGTAGGAGNGSGGSGGGSGGASDHGGGPGGGGGAALRGGGHGANGLSTSSASHARFATPAKKPSVVIAGHRVSPGGNGLFNLSTAADALPAPLIAALIALAIAALGGGAYVLRRRIPALQRLGLPNLALPRVPLPRLRR